MKKFYRKVDLRSRKAMTSFLADHFRYNTMNGWNRSTSYANCVKLHRLELDPDVEKRCFDLLYAGDARGVYESLIMDEWARKHQFTWQIGQNGRNGGYLVLYQGGLDYENAHTAQCDLCGRFTYHKEATPCTASGCAGTLRAIDKPQPQVITYPGREVDQSADFETWDIYDLRSRVILVQDFDACCDSVVASFVDTATNYDVVEEEIMVPTMVKTLRERSREVSHAATN